MGEGGVFGVWLVGVRFLGVGFGGRARISRDLVFKAGFGDGL